MLFERVGEHGSVGDAILVIEENPLLAIAPLDDVMRHFGYDNSG